MALLLWSGGCDSTLLLYTMLKYYNGEVRTIAINHQNVLANGESKKCRTKLIKKLSKIKKFKHTEINIKHNNNLVYPKLGASGLIQPAIWILTASLYLEYDEDLYVGYVKGDDVWHQFNNLTWAFSYIQATIGKIGKIITPFEWVGKFQVIDKLMRLRLISFCWWCGDPAKGKRCNKCGSCEAHKLSRYERKIMPNKLFLPDIFKKK